MSDASPRPVRAWCDSLTEGSIVFDRDWAPATAPELSLGSSGPRVAALAPASSEALVSAGAYYFPDDETVAFVLPVDEGGIDPDRDRIYLAGDFNGWQKAVGDAAWRLERREIDGGLRLAWIGPRAKVFWPTLQRFKFVTGDHVWLVPREGALNIVADEAGNSNHLLDPARTGRHLWRFRLDRPLDLAESWTVSVGTAPAATKLPLAHGPFFFELKTDLPLGALTGRDQTIFRLFAPRARGVTLHLCRTLEGQAEPVSFPLVPRPSPEAHVWEVALDENLHGWFYWYSVDGIRKGPNRFDPAARVVDPYALATVSGAGPGIVLDRAWIGKADHSFLTPAWHDLAIAEAHVGDLAAQAPIAATPEERRGFVGLRRWVDSPQFHLHHLGVNCVELQPVQEADNRTPEEYHWGYMTTNYFSPASRYSLAPSEASGVRELQALVAAFHRRGMAVVFDVVYNHIGEPPHLGAVDRLYYLEHDAKGDLSNWSGCGNDFRASAAMSRRLIVDSLLYLMETYGVDGFRFDLAELLGIDVLREIETALKRVKPDVILIAEPWSFRGHIASALRDTGWASWNDGFRDFVRDYVRGRGPAERLEYFLRGSPWYFAKWPAQTVNYTESHDDRAWIDSITENASGDGSVPTANDRRRTHLMAAALFLSLGIPMVSAGQDFLRSKQGLSNTYQRGDINALDYKRWRRNFATHAYFADWIAFRRGPIGLLLRHFTRPSEEFFHFFRASAPEPLAAIYNADHSLGSARLLFAINPTTEDVSIPVGEAVAESARWRLLADQDQFYREHGQGSVMTVEADLFVPGLGCCLWIADE